MDMLLLKRAIGGTKSAGADECAAVTTSIFMRSQQMNAQPSRGADESLSSRGRSRPRVATCESRQKQLEKSGPPDHFLFHGTGQLQARATTSVNVVVGSGGGSLGAVSSPPDSSSALPPGGLGVPGRSISSVPSSPSSGGLLEVSGSAAPPPPPGLAAPPPGLAALSIAGAPPPELAVPHLLDRNGYDDYQYPPNDHNFSHHVHHCDHSVEEAHVVHHNLPGGSTVPPPPGLSTAGAPPPGLAAPPPGVEPLADLAAERTPNTKG